MITALFKGSELLRILWHHCSRRERLAWNPSAEKAFQQLKTAFTTSYIFKHPDPAKPFIDDVDAFKTGVGSFLSQRFSKKPKLHQVAFSRKLSPAEQNYDTGSHKLLVLKLALEEWHHWLEWAEHPFIIFTDHKNLEYFWTDKHLNPHQACWSFFTSSLSHISLVSRIWKLTHFHRCTMLSWKRAVKSSFSHHLASWVLWSWRLIRPLPTYPST